MVSGHDFARQSPYRRYACNGGFLCGAFDAVPRVLQLLRAASGQK
jgi:hypothetical protein